MTATPWECVVAALAINQLVEISRHSALEPFPTLRLLAESSESVPARLWRCGWCLSVWVGFAVAALGWGPRWLLVCQEKCGNAAILARADVAWLGFYALATSRAANLLNDISHGVSRTPKG